MSPGKIYTVSPYTAPGAKKATPATASLGRDKDQGDSTLMLDVVGARRGAPETPSMQGMAPPGLHMKCLLGFLLLAALQAPAKYQRARRCSRLSSPSPSVRLPTALGLPCLQSGDVVLGHGTDTNVAIPGSLSAYK